MGRIQRVNAQAESMFGYSRKELAGKAVDFLLPDRFQTHHGRLRNLYFSEPSTRPMGVGLELYGMRKSGDEFPVDIMISPVETDEGRYVISSIRDITDRKQMEAELAEVQRRLIESAESERTYLAQELHDGPIQDLYAVSFQLKSMNSAINDQEEGEDVELAADTVQQVISVLRSICGELRPPALTPFGLQKAIEGHLEQIMEAHPELEVQADLMADGQALSERLRLSLYRIYQHAVSNVVRHSGARHLDVNFTFNDHHVILEIQDDGQGFELPARWVELARKGHLGIVGTAERAEALGGDLKIVSQPGKGTLVRVTVPREGEQGKFLRRGFVIARPGQA
jgi:PAS domain S-box-containing protein